MNYLGDFRTGKTVRSAWNTTAIAGESVTRATNGTVSVYKDGNTTQSTAGVTDSEDFDALTGVHLVTIDTSADGTFYSAGSDFIVVLSGATIDGKTINAALFSFSLENRSHLMPTTDGRKLDVSAGGEAGVDWANVGSPTTVVGLSGTTVKAVTDAVTAGTVSDKTGYSLSGTQTFNVTGNITGNLSGSVGSVTGAVGSVAGNVGGNVAGSVASVTAPVTAGTVSDKTGYRLSAAGVDDVLDEVVEGSYTVRQYLRGMASALLAKLSGAATTTVTIRDTADAKARVTATVDADGNRTAVTLDLT